jgi:hypothetical protein
MAQLRQDTREERIMITYTKSGKQKHEISYTIFLCLLILTSQATEYIKRMSLNNSSDVAEEPASDTEKSQ